MLYCPPKYLKPRNNLNEELSKLEGDLSDKEAKISLAKFLYHNIGFTTELISGVKLNTYQELHIKMWLLRNFNLCIWGRGCSKSFSVSVFSFLYTIFNPGSKLLIAAPTFRNSRLIFDRIEEFTKAKGAELLKQCFTEEASHKNDLYSWRINEGSILAIPLAGEKIRGLRAQVLIIDELAQITEKTIKEILMPFLVANDNIKERLTIKEVEDELIKAGRMTEMDRTPFINNIKLIGLSSASYTFEYLYTMFNEWIAKICDQEIRDATYFVSRLSYKAIPEEMLAKEIIEEAQSGGENSASFRREYCSEFLSESDGFYSARKLLECTIPPGEQPHLLLRGDKNKKYIIAIDPSFSNSPSADNFAMCVLELDEENKQTIVVHQYAKAGKDLKDHINYFYYIYTNFNTVLVVIDNADGNFIQACNESELFRRSNIELKFFDFETTAEGIDYEIIIKEVRRTYNLQDKKICFKQFFGTGDFLRKANENLQACIDYKRVWFASSIRADGNSFDKAINCNIPLDLTGFNGNIGELVDEQDLLLLQVKKELALIQLTTTTRGTYSFDIPAFLKKDKSPHRARRDSYTALMLGTWGAKCYFDLISAPAESSIASFEPFIV